MKTCYPLHGLVPIINTPFDENLEIDIPSLGRLLERGIAEGIAGCIVPAVASEVSKLSPEERRLLETASPSAVHPGHCRVEDLMKAELARHALAVGCPVPGRVPSHPSRNGGILHFSPSWVPDEMLMIQDLPNGYGMKSI
jgi:hypothetical protein